MEWIESITKQVSELTPYDVKSYIEKAKNMALNVPEMEAKVKEATNDDPWGASSTLMQQIAQGTFNFQEFNEIMPTIYRRFMDKEAREWRQIYKALQLLEYLVKHGSERVVDDARAHVSTIKMLRNFHYIDEKGKDQGINVRNRASELASLLGDFDRIRTERRKAKANRAKYVGTGNDGLSGVSFNTGGSRYGGFGSDSLQGMGGSRSSYDYGGGGSSGGFRDSRPGRQSFDEYDAGDFEDRPAVSSSHARTTSSGRATAAAQKPEPPKPKEPEVNLFDFGDEDTASAAPAAMPPAAMPAPASKDAFDDFDDFQSAPASAPAPAPALAPAPAAPAASAPRPAGGQDIFALLNASSSTPAAAAPRQSPAFNSSYAPSPAAAAPPSYFSSAAAPTMKLSTPALSSSVRPPLTAQASTASIAATAASTPGSTKSSGGFTGFDDLWTSSIGTSAAKPGGVQGAQGQGKATMASLAQQKTAAGIWGTPTSASPAPGGQRPPTMGASLAGASTPSAAPPSGGDDLLL